MKPIYIALIPLVVLSLISVLLGGNFTAIEVAYLKYSYKKIKFTENTVVFEINEIAFGISFLVLITTAVIIAGFQFLGSGLSNTSIKIMLVLVVYIALWTVLSILSLELLFLNKLIGSVIYTFLCLIYIIGVGQVLSG